MAIGTNQSELMLVVNYCCCIGIPMKWDRTTWHLASLIECYRYRKYANHRVNLRLLVATELKLPFPW